ncbi:MAG: sigma-70 family RNA polymerase sigma factor [Nannocystaceae bacterium]|nr:sigma-70 family RNA polymerase sigma factor [Nannocystaceae bacterium]
MSETDLEVLRLALGGNASSQRALADKLMDGIQREVAFCLLRAAGASQRDPRQEVRDLVQDVLVALFKNDAQELRRWDPNRGRSLDSFVRLVARRLVARTLGQRRGNPWADAPIDPTEIDDTGDSQLVQRLQDRAELDQVLVALYSTMAERDHELFDLLFVQQRDPDEVATRMAMSRGAVNAWRYRTRKLARAIVAQSETQLSSVEQSSPKEKSSRGG